jgi:hypothetical protein
MDFIECMRICNEQILNAMLGRSPRVDKTFNV